MSGESLHTCKVCHRAIGSGYNWQWLLAVRTLTDRHLRSSLMIRIITVQILLDHCHGGGASDGTAAASGTPSLAPYNVAGGLEHVSEALALQHRQTCFM